MIPEKDPRLFKSRVQGHHDEDYRVGLHSQRTCRVWCSYILALLGREQIAEALSQVALKEIIGVVLIYGPKALFENLSKNNSWPDKGNSTPPEDGAG